MLDLMLPSPLHDRVLMKRIRVLIKRIEEQETVKGEIITLYGLVELRKAIGYFWKNIRERK